MVTIGGMIRRCLPHIAVDDRDGMTSTTEAIECSETLDS